MQPLSPLIPNCHRGVTPLKAMGKRQCSGQILVLAVLLVSLILLSTQVYVFEVGRLFVRTESSHIKDFVLAVRLGSEHVVVGSLVNITTEGYNSTLSTNLGRWVNLTSDLYQFGKAVLSFAVKNITPYADGVHLSWGASGSGVSSAYVDFNFTLSDRQADIQLSYDVNITTSLTDEGSYRRLTGDWKQINLTCNVMNEGAPALIKNMTIYYEDSGSWIPADQQQNYSFTDYGNGTYLTTFEVSLSEDSINVSAQVYDLRQIYVQANTTCTES